MFGSNREYDKLSAKNEELKKELKDLKAEAKDLKAEAKDLKVENNILHKDKQNFKEEAETLNKIFEEIITLSSCNTFNNEKAILGKIRELAQSTTIKKS